MVLTTSQMRMSIVANTDMENLGVRVGISGHQGQFMKETLRMARNREEADGRRFNYLTGKKW